MKIHSANSRFFSRIFFAFSFSLFLFSSCSRNLYLPSVVYAPQLDHKHEGEIGVNGNVDAGVQVQTAFALTNHFGLQAQANAVSKKSGDFLGGPNYWLKYKLDEHNDFLVSWDFPRVIPVARTRNMSRVKQEVRAQALARKMDICSTTFMDDGTAVISNIPSVQGWIIKFPSLPAHVFNI